MKNRNNWWIVLVLLFAGSTHAQDSTYQWKRPLLGVTQNWHALYLPEDVYGALRSDRADLRISGTGADGKPLIAPYLLRTPQMALPDTQRVFSVRQAQLHDTQAVNYMLSLPAATAIGHLKLDFPQENFDYRIDVLYSLDAEEWFPVDGDFRVVAFRQDGQEYQYNELRFPPVRARYFRLRLAGTPRARLVSATGIVPAAGAVAEVSFTRQALRIEESATTRETRLSATLRYRVPVQAIRFFVPDSLPFYRPVRIQAYDEANLLRYDVEAFLHSAHPEIRLPEAVPVRKFVITLSHHDDMPLPIDSLGFTGKPDVLLIRFPDPAARWYLLYGNPAAHRPQYDLAHFPEIIPVTAPRVTLGQPHAQHPVVRTQTGIKQKKPEYLFWGILAGVVVLLGVSTVHMIRSK